MPQLTIRQSFERCSDAILRSDVRAYGVCARRADGEMSDWEMALTAAEILLERAEQRAEPATELTYEPTDEPDPPNYEDESQEPVYPLEDAA